MQRWRFGACLAASALLLPAGEAAAEEALAQGAAAPDSATEPEPEAGATPASVDELVAALADRDPERRIAAARALGATGSPEAEAALVAMLASEPSPEVRAWAVRGLAELDTDQGRASLARVAGTDPDPRVRSLAAHLSGLGMPPPVGAVEAAAAAAPAPALDPEAPATPREQPSRTTRRLLIAGWTTFGVSYLGSLVAGITLMALASPDYFWPLIVPGAGPGILAGLMLADGGEGASIPAALTLFAMAVQVAGIALLAVGHHRLRAAGDQRQARPRRVELAFAPFGPGGGSGLGVVGWY